MENKNKTLMGFRYDYEVSASFIEKFKSIDFVAVGNEKAKEMQDFIFEKTGIVIENGWLNIHMDNNFMLHSWAVDSDERWNYKRFFCTALEIRQYDQQFEGIKWEIDAKLKSIIKSYGIERP